ncbi:hypothetical protein [Sphingomonas sp.]|jgi:hypothetical protein|uniref:hypothetical protein n=1 Tax=Sphingomonas sp. TaxID=28214 RepID=UPI002D7E7274|nr:hypothetical protein [Sphingomonas sp.]HEU0044122.1 hypothetical protein [Sphingomonas sp.]
MVRIDSVWDGTTEVLGRRGGLLASIAFLAFFLPSAGQAAVAAYGGTSTGVALLSAVVTLVALVASVWGSLTVIGLANDPAASRAAAGRQATARLPAALLLMLVAIAVAVVAALPTVGVLAANGYDFQAAVQRAGGAGAPKLAPGVALFLFVYGLLLLLVALWLYARLLPLLPVALHERRRIGAFGRALRLTRGMTWRLIGVVLLFGVVFMVASWAAQAVVGTAARLLLGAEHITTATFIGALAAALVAAAFATVVAVFGARLYAALRAGGAAPAA